MQGALSQSKKDHSLLTRNQKYLDDSKKNWKMQPISEIIRLVVNPAAYSLEYLCLHPQLYRNLRGIEVLNKLASLLNAPSTWEQKFNETVLESQPVLRKLKHLLGCTENETEPNIRAAFSALVWSVANCLEIDLREQAKKIAIVGGILARSEYFVQSKTGPYFKNNQMQTVIAAEVFGNDKFKSDEVWYHGSRGPRLFTALYYHNAPTFLLSQQNWKLFVENPERTAVYSFPCEEEDPDDPCQSSFLRSCLMYRMGRTLVRAICICLLAKPGDPVSECSLSDAPLTPPPPMAEYSRELCEGPSKKSRTTPRAIQGGQAATLGIPTASFVAENESNGEVARCIVYVVPSDTAEEILRSIPK
jgi:hypothetical protein